MIAQSNRECLLVQNRVEDNLEIDESNTNHGLSGDIVEVRQSVFFRNTILNDEYSEASFDPEGSSSTSESEMDALFSERMGDLDHGSLVSVMEALDGGEDDDSVILTRSRIPWIQVTLTHEQEAAGTARETDDEIINEGGIDTDQVFFIPLKEATPGHSSTKRKPRRPRRCRRSSRLSF